MVSRRHERSSLVLVFVANTNSCRFPTAIYAQHVLLDIRTVYVYASFPHMAVLTFGWTKIQTNIAVDTSCVYLLVCLL